MFEFQFDSVAAFVAMGGNGVFVWFSYFAFAAVVAWNFWQPKQERQRIVRLLRARLARDQPTTVTAPTAGQQSNTQAPVEAQSQG
jgi:heme exporter protein D